MVKKHLLKKELEWCLENKPKTRNSDKLLWESLLWNYYSLNENLPINDLREFHEYIMKVPSQDAVKRIRAQFNSKGQYLPDDPKVIKRRKLEEKHWTEDLDYNTQEVAIQQKQDKLNLKHWWDKD